jgi:hypothetical protein
MNSLPGAADAGERLKRTATIDPHGVPVPSLLKYALDLIGLKACGPDEKVGWWVNFTYQGEPFVLAYEKFGLRLYLRTEAPEEEARKTQVQVAKQLRSSMRTVEKLILNAAPELLGKGNATVVNQHRSLRRAYEYFRERALEPTVIEDETIEYGPDGIAGIQWAVTFKSGVIQMQLNAFHDMIAAISTPLSTPTLRPGSPTTATCLG